MLWDLFQKSQLAYQCGSWHHIEKQNVLNFLNLNQTGQLKNEHDEVSFSNNSDITERKHVCAKDTVLTHSDPSEATMLFFFNI